MPIHQAVKPHGKGRDQTFEIVQPVTHGFQGIGVDQAVLGEKLSSGITAVVMTPQGDAARGVEICGTDPQGRLKPLAQPVGQTNVVWVHVRHDDTQNGQRLHELAENALPLGAGRGAVNAAIHHRPAGHAIHLVSNQPQVDVIQGKGQFHPYPEHTGRHLQAQLRVRQRVVPGVVQFELVRVHAGIVVHV